MTPRKFLIGIIQSVLGKRNSLPVNCKMNFDLQIFCVTSSVIVYFLLFKI